jgi:hypothetical protein
MATESITARFLKAFNPSVKEHVVWLKKITDDAQTRGDPSAAQNIVAEMNTNPMGVKMTTMEALDWPHVHFVLCASYAKAVFQCRAWVPGMATTVQGLSIDSSSSR